jgi:hypothetical protein
MALGYSLSQILGGNLQHWVENKKTEVLSLGTKQHVIGHNNIASKHLIIYKTLALS